MSSQLTTEHSSLKCVQNILVQVDVAGKLLSQWTENTLVSDANIVSDHP